MSADAETTIKLTVYRTIAETGRAPDAAEVAAASGFSEAEVRASFARLHGRRLLVPEPGDPSRIRMAPPFSGVETAVPVDAMGKRYYANCVWDAYGIPAALHADAVITAADGFTREPLTLEVRGGQPVLRPYLAHFAVPAALWWENIIDT